jgi:hypothetical protein
MTTPPTPNGGLPFRDKMTVLRGQLSNILAQAAQGIPIPVDCIARAEKLARSLESGEPTT